MAVVNRLNLNVGTEQNPNFVLHDINDKRISTTAVTTATHLLSCNSGVTSIAPITAANLASVLGNAVMRFKNTVDDLNEIYGNGLREYQYSTLVPSNKPSGSSNYGVLISIGSSLSPFGTLQIWIDAQHSQYAFYCRLYWDGSWRTWKKITVE